MASASAARARARWRAQCGDRPRLGPDRYSPGGARLGWAAGAGRLCQGRALRRGCCSGHLQGRGAARPQPPCGGGGRVGAALRPHLLLLLLLLVLPFAPSCLRWHRPAAGSCRGAGSGWGPLRAGGGAARGGTRAAPRHCPFAALQPALPAGWVLPGSDPRCPHLRARRSRPARERPALPASHCPPTMLPDRAPSFLPATRPAGAHPARSPCPSCPQPALPPVPAGAHRAGIPHVVPGGVM